MGGKSPRKAIKSNEGVAGLTQVDGAVVITHRLELIGFGAEISGKLKRVDSLAQALDPEGFEIRKEKIGGVGTSHHSAYNFWNALHNVVAVVISQDGTAQLVKWYNGMATVWDKLSPSLIEV